MFVLRIEHPVPDYDAWKQAFESDPTGWRRSGVRLHRVLRPVDDLLNYVEVDLEFASEGEARSVLTALRQLWERVDVVRDPRARILNVVDTEEYWPGSGSQPGFQILVDGASRF